MLRNNLEILLASFLITTIVLFGFGVVLKILENRPNPLHTMTCKLKDESLVKADSFVIRENSINLSLNGGELLIPYAELRFCITS